MFKKTLLGLQNEPKRHCTICSATNQNPGFEFSLRALVERHSKPKAQCSDVSISALRQGGNREKLLRRTSPGCRCLFIGADYFTQR